MLANWSLVPLPFLKPAWTSGSSWFIYCWSLAWRSLSVIHTNTHTHTHTHTHTIHTHIYPLFCRFFSYIGHYRVLRRVSILYSRSLLIIYCIYSSEASCLTFCDPIDCSPPGSSIHGIFQARILGWVTISYSRGSSLAREWIWVSMNRGSWQTMVHGVMVRHDWATLSLFICKIITKDLLYSTRNYI